MELSEIIDSLLSEPRLLAALLGLYGLITVTLYNSIDRRRKAIKEKSERRKDMQKAIYSEISAFVTLQEQNHLDRFGKSVIHKIQNEDFRPFLIREKYSAVYEALMADIHYLPVETIDIITRYYQRVNFVSDMKEAMLSEKFDKLDKNRRALVYEHYIATMRYALDEGREALKIIGMYSEYGKSAVLDYQRNQRKMRSEKNKAEVTEWVNAQKHQ